MSDVSTPPAGSAYYAEPISDTPIFSALAATIPPFCSPAAAHDLRSSTRAPASFSRSCVLPRTSTGGGRHRRSLTLAEDATSTGRHHLITPSYT